MRKTKIAPSMMCADFLNLKEELDLFKKFEIDLLHMDIMDGRYVPNFTLGIDFCKSVASYSSIPQDFHLMVDEPERYIDSFTQIPGSVVTFHPEVSRHPVRTIERIRELGGKPGIAIDPALTIESMKHLLPLVDQVCIMSVNPGYAGQKLLPFCIDKVKELKDYLDKNSLTPDIEIDGNVSWENIPKMVEAGANVLVVGSSSVFDKKKKREDTLAQLQSMLVMLKR